MVSNSINELSNVMGKYDIVKYYSNPKVAEHIASASQGREIAGAFWNGSYDKRPNIAQYASDVVKMAENGITSFHVSVEHWQNPMMLSSGMQASDYDKIRTGWDILLDMDSKIGMEGGKQCALAILGLLDKYNITSYGVKFSGSRGFHIVLPNSIFPKEIDYKLLAKEYPRIPRIIALFIEDQIRDDLMERLLKYKSYQELCAMLNEPPANIDPFNFVELETNWGARHMFRAPFSLNEKTWLVSIPLNRDELTNFFKGMALPKNVGIHLDTPFFYDTSNVGEEGTDLLIDAMDWHAKNQRNEELPSNNRKRQRTEITVKMKEEDFPPCIKLILKGITDGRKRSLFTLINFLNRMNWTSEEIIERVRRWNDTSPKPLPNSMINSQLRYHIGGGTLPGNCDNINYYKAAGPAGGLCHPDETCVKFKVNNPISYPFKKYLSRQKDKEDKEFISEARGEIFKCNKCDRAFTTEKSLNMHYGRAHGSSEY